MASMPKIDFKGTLECVVPIHRGSLTSVRITMRSEDLFVTLRLRQRTRENEKVITVSRLSQELGKIYRGEAPPEIIEEIERNISRLETVMHGLFEVLKDYNS